MSLIQFLLFHSLNKKNMVGKQNIQSSLLKNWNLPWTAAPPYAFLIKFAQAIRAADASWKTIERSPTYPSWILLVAVYGSLNLVEENKCQNLSCSSGKVVWPQAGFFGRSK